MNSRYALVNERGEVVSVSLWDGVTPWTPPPGLTAVPEAEAVALPAAKAAASPRVVSPRAFMDRLSAGTQARIAAAATASGDMMLLLVRLAGGDVDLDAAETKAGVAAMTAAGLLTASEAEALLA